MTTDCKECKYFKDIMGLKTCRKQNQILNDNVVGCYGGEKGWLMKQDFIMG